MKITIDGYAASGKGTLARLLSKKLDIPYLDSGKIYRYAVYHLLSHTLIYEDSTDKDLKEVINNESITLRLQQDILQNIHQLETLSKDINFYSPIISHFASKISAIAEFRYLIIKPQQEFMRQNGGAIMDGRDIGSVICPEADIKFFLTGKAEIRAKRRYEELKNKNLSINFETLLYDLKQRDKQDSERKISPLKKTRDSIVIDTSHKEIKEILEVALKHVIKQNQICK